MSVTLPGRFQKQRWFWLIPVLVILALSFLLAYAMFYESLKSRWSMVDDPEIAYYLGSDHHVGLGEAAQIILRDTEIGQYGYFTRFRPVYFAARLLESWLWNDELVFWYWSNIVMFAFFVGTFWFLASRKINFFLAGLLTFFMAAQTYWIDTFGRLGPSEPYAAVGLALFAWGLYLIYQLPKRPGLGWSLMAVGGMICTGSKENFVVLLLLIAAVAWERWRSHQFSLWPRIWLALTALWNLWIFSAIGLAVLRTGRDVYQNSVGPSRKILELMLAINRPDVIGLFILLAALAWIGFALRKKNSRVSRLLLFVAASLAFLWIVYLTQFLIYGGDFPNGDRYDVPGMLAWPLAAVLLVWLFQQITAEVPYASYRMPVMLISALVCVALAFSQIGGVQTAQAKTRKYVKDNTRFTRSLDKMSAILKQSPSTPLVLQLDNPILDYAPITAYDLFLRYYYGAPNPIAIYWAGHDMNRYDPLSRSIAAIFIEISDHGATVLEDSPVRPVDFAPISSVKGRQCILVLLSSDQPRMPCYSVYSLP